MFSKPYSEEIKKECYLSNVIYKSINNKESLDSYFLPCSSEIRIIDFGNATYLKNKSSNVINTRQYRAPEVVLSKY